MKRKLCIVHIGMPKTGSSALQESLFSNITDKNVNYSDLKTISHSAIMYSLFSSIPENHYYHESMNHTTDEVNEFNTVNKKLLIESFKTHQSDIEIISGEDIFHLDEQALSRMKDFLYMYFKKIIIVGYVRSPKSFMESAFQQLVKYHKLSSFDFSIIYPHYKEKLEKFDKVFDSKNVNLWKYDPKNFLNSDITLDFCGRLNIEANKKECLRANDSITKEALSLLFANNKYGRQFDFGIMQIQIEHKLVGLLSAIGSSKFKFSKKMMDDITTNNQDDIEWVENRLGTSLQESTHDIDTVDSVENLLLFSDEIMNELKKLIGPKDLLKDYYNSPKDIAYLVDMLKIKLANEYNSSVREISKLDESLANEYEILEKLNINWNNYYEKNDLDAVPSDPIVHYLNNWKTKELMIDNFFNTREYLELYRDIEKSNINPLIHYLLHGKKEGRRGRK